LRRLAHCLGWRRSRLPGPQKPTRSHWVLFVITFRPEFQPPWGGHPHVTTLALNRLGGREVDALVLGIAAAADQFRIAFRVAHIDALRAAEMARTMGTGGRPQEPPIWAKRLVNEVVIRLGGEKSIAASAVWFIIGLEIPISRWSLEHAGINRHAGTGVLLAALGILAFYFSGRRSAA